MNFLEPRRDTWWTGMIANMPSKPMEWHPALLFRSDVSPAVHPCEFSLIVLNQPLNDPPTLNRLWRNSSLHVAADGGANRLLDFNQQTLNGGGDVDTDVLTGLHTIIGDLDSLSDEAHDHFTHTHPQPVQIIHNADQSSTDFTKAVEYVRARCPGADIVAMGGLGGRVDQGLSQLHHLYKFQSSPTYEEGILFLVSGESLTFLLKAGRHRIAVREQGLQDVFGKYVGIVPVKEPSVISTWGLEWDVKDWPTEIGGQVSTSNHVLAGTTAVEVETTKDILFTISLKEQEE